MPKTALGTPNAELKPEFVALLRRTALLQREFARPPLSVELVEREPVPKRTTQFRINWLSENGLLDLGGSTRSRYVELTEKALALLATHEPHSLGIKSSRLDTPLAVNPARCGALTETAAEPREYVETLGQLFKCYRAGDQLLDAEGDSMTAAPESGKQSIMDGDRVLWRPDAWPEPGDIAYVEYELPNGTREGTLKEWRPLPGGQVRLHARNPKHEDIVLPENEVIVRGVVQVIIRQVKGK